MKQDSKLLMSSQVQNNDKTLSTASAEKPSMSEGTNTKMAITQNAGANRTSSAKTHPWRAYGSKLKG